MNNVGAFLLCAWILWATFGGGRATPLSGWETAEECRGALSLKEQELRQKDVRGTLLVCLPDTVDPRHPN